MPGMKTEERGPGSGHRVGEEPDSDRSPSVPKNYPCRKVLVERRCDEPSTYHATGNEAKYGHVCGDCWESFDDHERSLYAWVGLRNTRQEQGTFGGLDWNRRMIAGFAKGIR